MAETIEQEHARYKEALSEIFDLCDSQTAEDEPWSIVQMIGRKAFSALLIK